MNNMLRKYLSFAALAGVLSVSGCQSKSISRGMKAPVCNIDKPVPTYVHFFVANEALKGRSQQEIHTQMQFWVNYSNWVLENSCIPMTRNVAEVTFVDLSDHYVLDFSSAHYSLESVLGADRISQIRQQSNYYYALILGSENTFFKGDLHGQAERAPHGHFIALRYNTSQHVLEHEFGHLAWAEHDTETLKEQVGNNDLTEISAVWEWPYIKPYARAYLCANGGTIMSYAPKRRPFYSSPQISFNGEVCGDAKAGDNARVLRDYAQRLRERMASVGQGVAIN